MTTSRLVLALLCTALLMAVGASGAQAQTIVGYDGLWTSGFSDGGDPGKPGIPPTVGATQIDLANDAIPVCRGTRTGAGGMTTWMNGAQSAPQTRGTTSFIGIAEVAAGAFPQAVKFFAQTPANGFQVNASTCKVTVTNFGPTLWRRTQLAQLTWPGPAGGTVSAGNGPALAIPTWTPPFANLGVFNQQVALSATVGAAKFGGAVAANGFGNTELGIRLGAGGPYFQGIVPVNIFIGGSNATAGARSQIEVQSTVWPGVQGPPGGTMAGSPVGGALTFVASGAAFPWTTGTVMAFDNVGDFTSTRTITGNDGRTTANGTNGTLSLVSPGLLLMTGVFPLGIAITTQIDVTMTPEPGASMLLASGVVGLIGLHRVSRRRQR